MIKPSSTEQQADTVRPKKSARGDVVTNAPAAKVGFRSAIVSGLFAFVALFGGIGGWMSAAQISGAVVASGYVSVKGEAKTIQHLDGGIVAEINVSDGDVVHAGDVLVRLDRTLLETNQNIYRNRLAEALARRARLMAERDGKTRIIWPDVAASPLGVQPGNDLRLSQQRLLQARLESRKGQLAQFNEKIAQYKNQIDGMRGLKVANAQQIELIDRELSGLRTLYEKGNTTLNRLLSLERQKSNLLGQQAEHDAQIARVSNLINETRIQIVQVDRDFREKVLSELRSTEQELNDNAQQLLATRDKLNRVVIKSPVDGRVHQLQFHTIGGVVAPGGALLQIVPTEQAVEINAKIEPQFVDDVSVGQKAALRFSAFNQRETPELFGTVHSVSPSSVVNQKTGASFYIVQIDVPDAELAKIGGRHRLVAGMPVEAFVRKKDRTVLNYIAKPLMDQVYRAFRED
jgi:membrane fusion protein, type I secretion system